MKIALILPIVYCGSLSLAYCRTSLDPITSQYIQIFFSFAGVLVLVSLGASGSAAEVPGVSPIAY